MTMRQFWNARDRVRYLVALLLLLVIPLGMSAFRGKQSTAPFMIKVVDAQTGAGVPSLQVTADNGIVCDTRADGSVTFREDSLMNRSVFFKIEGQDHHFPGGGKTIRVTHGGHAELKIPR